MVWTALGEYRGPSSCKALVRYVIARYNSKQTQLTCVIYIAEALRQSGRGYYLTTRLSDMLFGSKEEEKSAEDIIDDIASRLEG